MEGVDGTFRWVLLRHELPGDAVRADTGREASWHYDWMIEEEGNEGLVCFRVMVRVDALARGERFEGERLADHRRAYLAYEGEISGGRGRVMRVAAGACGGWREVNGCASLVIGRVKVMGRAKSGTKWEFAVG